jgi:hypothetical protein
MDLNERLGLGHNMSELTYLPAGEKESLINIFVVVSLFFGHPITYVKPVSTDPR